MQDITEQVAANEQAIEAFESEVPKRAWNVKGYDDSLQLIERTYIQEELSFFGVQQFTNMMAGFIKKFINGELGVSLKELFSGGLTERISMPQMSDMSADKAQEMVDDNSDLILGVIETVQAIPGLEIEIIMLSMGVPRNERQWAAAVLQGPVSRGGMSRAQGFDVLKTFVSQNAQAIRDFFSEQGRDLVDHVRAEVFGSETESGEDSEAPAEEEAAEELATTRGGMPSSTTPPPPASTLTSSEDGPQVVSS